MDVREGRPSALSQPQAADGAVCRLPRRVRPEGHGEGDRACRERRHRRVPLRLLLVQRADHAGGGAGEGVSASAQPRPHEVRAHVVLPRAERPVPSAARRAAPPPDVPRAHEGGVPRPHRPLHRALLSASGILAQGRQALLLVLQLQLLLPAPWRRPRRRQGRARRGARAGARRRPRRDPLQRAEHAGGDGRSVQGVRHRLADRLQHGAGLRAERSRAPRRP